MEQRDLQESIVKNECKSSMTQEPKALAPLQTRRTSTPVPLKMGAKGVYL